MAQGMRRKARPKQAKRKPVKKASTPQLTHRINRHMREGVSIVLFAIGIFLLTALLTFHINDPGWSHTGLHNRVVNGGGKAGAWFADISLYLFGYAAFFLPAMVMYSGYFVFSNIRQKADDEPTFAFIRWLACIILLLTACSLASIHFVPVKETLPQGVPSGGIFGLVISRELVGIFNPLGSTLLLIAMFLGAFTLFTGLSWFTLMDWVGKVFWAIPRWGQRLLSALKSIRGEESVVSAGKVIEKKREATLKVEVEKRKTKKPPRIAPKVSIVEPGDRLEKERQLTMFGQAVDNTLPPLSMLDMPTSQSCGFSKEALEAMSRQLEIKLADFNVSVDVVAVHPGPVITRFELQPAPGVKVSQIVALSKDIARSLSVVSVRVVEIIAGKTTVGLEIPNEAREVVRLREIVQSNNYEQSPSPLTIALGKDIGGKPVVADLAKMPHLLVAGTTGSGKSVGINAMLLSLIYKASARDIRLILIDPKMLELSTYEGIPHLLAPVVTDMSDAANALRWCVAEMERRYRLMASLGVRNITGCNRKILEAMKAGSPLVDPLYKPEDNIDPEAPAPTLEKLPYIVVVIDELADLMMVVGKKVEELIARIAQKARAAGIHLILATQRPSVDVITGLIKANVPTRIAFQVSSKVDSRTILDQIGAETLLGNGDMLYLPPGTALPVRIHGAFVDDHEVHKVVKFLREHAEPDYLDDVLSEPTEAIPGLSKEANGDVGEQDPLYDQAVAIVTESRKASISYVQRRLKVGYNRAARMVEEMEQAGVVSRVRENGSREVLAPPPV